MGLDPIIILGLAILAGWLGVITIIILRRRARERKVLTAAEDGNLTQVISEALSDVSALEGRLSGLRRDLQQTVEELQTTVQRVGIIRFDAFDDVGGKLSFAVALLDNHGDGLVLSALNGRDTSRCYAKAISNRDSKVALSQEEREAISKAMSRQVMVEEKV